jgi:hypothetical protein
MKIKIAETWPKKPPIFFKSSNNNPRIKHFRFLGPLTSQGFNAVTPVLKSIHKIQVTIWETMVNLLRFLVTYSLISSVTCSVTRSSICLAICLLICLVIRSVICLVICWVINQINWIKSYVGST